MKVLKITDQVNSVLGKVIDHALKSAGNAVFNDVAFILQSFVDEEPVVPKEKKLSDKPSK